MLYEDFLGYFSWNFSPIYWESHCSFVKDKGGNDGRLN